MAEEEEISNSKKNENSEDAAMESSAKNETGSVDKSTELDLDEDLADALGEGDSTDVGDDVDVDQILGEADPNFSQEMAEIASADFSNVVIDSDTTAEEVDENAKAPSMFRAYFNNISQERKKRYLAALVVILILVPISILIFMGKLLPTFNLPFYLSMNELTEKTYSYELEDTKIPLFDSFRNNTVTAPLPKTMINLSSDGGEPVYGQFEFFLVLRDKEVEKLVQKKQTEILDLVQRILEQVSWDDLKSPLGKERVKKILRHQLNEYFQGNYVVGVYYRSVLLQK